LKNGHIKKGFIISLDRTIIKNEMERREMKECNLGCMLKQTRDKKAKKELKENYKLLVELTKENGGIFGRNNFSLYCISDLIAILKDMGISLAHNGKFFTGTKIVITKNTKHCLLVTIGELSDNKYKLYFNLSKSPN